MGGRSTRFPGRWRRLEGWEAKGTCVPRSDKSWSGWLEEAKGGTEPMVLRSRGASAVDGGGADLVVSFGGGPGGGPGRGPGTAVGAWGAMGTALGM
jgi:hypothetical protein